MQHIGASLAKSVPANLLAALPEYQKEIATILARYNFKITDFDDHTERMPLAIYVAIFEELAKLIGDTHLGIRVAKKMNPDTLGGTGYLFMSAENLGAALTSLAQYIDLIQDSTMSRLRIEDDMCHFEYQIQDDNISPRRQDAEFSMSYVAHLAASYSQGRCQPLEFHFEHAPTGSFSDYDSLLGAPIFFERGVNAVSFDRTEVNRPLNTKDHYLFRTLQSLLEDARASSKSDGNDASWASAVRHRLHERRVAQNPSATEIASRLGVSKITLYRRLSAEGTSFNAILKGRRCELAERFLRQPAIPISEISARLGYSEHSIFTRAFKKWTGQTPAQWRKEKTASGQQPPNASNI